MENRVLTDYNFETVPEQETIMTRSGMALVMVVVLFVPCSISAGSEGPSIPGHQTVRIGNVSTVPNGITTAPQLLRYVAPEYTDEARRRGIDGVVTAEVEFDINGACLGPSSHSGVGLRADGECHRCATEVDFRSGLQEWLTCFGDCSCRDSVSFDGSGPLHPGEG